MKSYYKSFFASFKLIITSNALPYAQIMPIMKAFVQAKMMTQNLLQQVPLLDLTRLNDSVKQEYIECFQRVLSSGRFILGEEVSAFEKECTRYLGTTHGIGVSSGTDALLTALMALEIGPGDEVLCPSFTFFSTASCITRIGATPIFVDCNPDTFNSTADNFSEKLTSKTKALIAVHLFGLPCEMGPILDFASSYHLKVIEDAAQAFGASTTDHKKVGTFGDLGCFSFFPSKNLGGFGDGGLMTTSSDKLAEKCCQLRNHGMFPKYTHTSVGGNFRLDALQAALLRIKLPRLEQSIHQRRQHAAHYNQKLSTLRLASRSEKAHKENALTLPHDPTGNHTFNQYTLRTNHQRRDELSQHLHKHRIGHEIYYPIPLHLQPCFKHLNSTQLPHSEQLAKEVIALPIFPELTLDELSYVVDSLFDFFN